MAEVLPQVRSLPRHDHPLHTILRVDSELVGVLVEDHHRRLIAVRDIAKGTHIFRVNGRETRTPTKYSVQVGDGLHIDEADAHDEFELVRRYFWRYLDHACEPSARILDREVVAVRDIAEGEAVTFHYCTTEYDMATPFHCHCGSARCLGLIRGARYLTATERRRLNKWMADYLR